MVKRETEVLDLLQRIRYPDGPHSSESSLDLSNKSARSINLDQEEIKIVEAKGAEEESSHFRKPRELNNSEKHPRFEKNYRLKVKNRKFDM